MHGRSRGKRPTARALNPNLSLNQETFRSLRPPKWRPSSYPMLRRIMLRLALRRNRRSGEKINGKDLDGLILVNLTASPAASGHRSTLSFQTTFLCLLAIPHFSVSVISAFTEPQYISCSKLAHHIFQNTITSRLQDTQKSRRRTTINNRQGNGKTSLPARNRLKEN